MKAVFLVISLVLIACPLCLAGGPPTNDSYVQNQSNGADSDTQQLLQHFLDQGNRPDEKKEVAPSDQITNIMQKAKKVEPRICMNYKGAKFGDVLRSLSEKNPFYYSISATPTGTSSSSSSIQQSPLSPRSETGMGQQSSPTTQGIYDIKVNVAYDGNSLDEAVGLLCSGADVYCKKKGNIWDISKYEMYIMDKDIFFTYSVSNGGGGSAGTTSTQPTSGAVGSTGSTVSASTGSTGAVGSASSGSSGSDSVSMSGNFDDYVSFIKTFLSKDGQVQISKGGYLVVMDVPSAIARIKSLMAKDTEMAGVRVKVDVISVTLSDDYTAGVNWNAVIKNAAIGGSFAPAGAFNLAYKTTHDGNPVQALLGVLGTYGNSKVVKSLDTTATNGIPIFFNVTEQIPYGQQSQQLSASGVGQTSTTVSYISVGLKIKLLPNIRENTLNGGIYAELSSLISMNNIGGSISQGGTTAPDTSLTNTAVPLSIKYGDTFVLTGFKTKTTALSATGVPVLSKIPIFGALFGSQQRNQDNSELCIVVTAVKDNKHPIGGSL